jgi:NTE family protein
MIRVLLAFMAQVGSLRHSEIAAALNSGRRKGGLWTCVTPPSEYPRWASALAVSDATAAQIAAIPIRLLGMNDFKRHRLANFGYAITDATLRSYVDQTLPEPSGFPWPGGVQE